MIVHADKGKYYRSRDPVSRICCEEQSNGLFNVTLHLPEGRARAKATVSVPDVPIYYLKELYNLHGDICDGSVKRAFDTD